MRDGRQGGTPAVEPGPKAGLALSSPLQPTLAPIRQGTNLPRQRLTFGILFEAPKGECFDPISRPRPWWSAPWRRPPQGLEKQAHRPDRSSAEARGRRSGVAAVRIAAGAPPIRRSIRAMLIN